MAHRLDYLKEVRGIGVFTARPGMGKSYCLRCFVLQFPVPIPKEQSPLLQYGYCKYPGLWIKIPVFFERFPPLIRPIPATVLQ